jgi:hypothetical protein
MKIIGNLLSKTTEGSVFKIKFIDFSHSFEMTNIFFKDLWFITTVLFAKPKTI